MTLKRDVSYEIAGDGKGQPIRVKAFASLKVVQIVKNDGDYHNDRDVTININFDQLAELIVALEELRTKHVPREHISDPY